MEQKTEQQIIRNDDGKSKSEIPPHKPPNPDFSFEKCPYGKGYWFFWWCFMRVQ